MDTQPFHGEQNGRQHSQTEQVGAGAGEAFGRGVEHERSERHEGDRGASEQGRRQDRYVPDLVPAAQCEVPDEKRNPPTLRAGATAEPNEAKSGANA